MRQAAGGNRFDLRVSLCREWSLSLLNLPLHTPYKNANVTSSIIIAMKFLYQAFRYWNIPKVVTTGIELLLLLLLISATFAFLPSKPPSSVGYEYTGKSFPTATHHASSMGLLFFQSRDVLDYSDIPWYKRKRCFLAVNRVDDIDSNGSGSITRSTGTGTRLVAVSHP